MPSRKLAGRTIGDPDGSFVIAEWTEGPAPQEGPRFVAPLHVHHRDDEAWYVLEGALRFRLDDEEREARAGEAVFAPRGTAHTYWNPGSDPARYVLVMTPTIFALINAIHAATERERDPKTLSALFAAFDSEILEDRSQR